MTARVVICVIAATAAGDVAVGASLSLGFTNLLIFQRWLVSAFIRLDFYDCFLLPFLSLFLTFLPSLSSFCSSLFPLPLSLFSVMRQYHNFLQFVFHTFPPSWNSAQGMAHACALPRAPTLCRTTWPAPENQERIRSIEHWKNEESSTWE